MIAELGGYARKHSRHARKRGNASDRHLDKVCRSPGGWLSSTPLWPARDGGQLLQQHNSFSLWYHSPGRPVRCEHHDSTLSSGEPNEQPGSRLPIRESFWRLGLLALQWHVPRKGASLVLQWVLHPECFPAVQFYPGRAPWELVKTSLAQQGSTQESLKVVMKRNIFPLDGVVHVTIQ